MLSLPSLLALLPRSVVWTIERRAELTNLATSWPELFARAASYWKTEVREAKEMQEVERSKLLVLCGCLCLLLVFVESIAVQIAVLVAEPRSDDSD